MSGRRGKSPARKECTYCGRVHPRGKKQKKRAREANWKTCSEVSMMHKRKADPNRPESHNVAPGTVPQKYMGYKNMTNGSAVQKVSRFNQQQFLETGWNFVSNTKAKEIQTSSQDKG